MKKEFMISKVISRLMNFSRITTILRVMEIFEPKYYKCTRITLEKRIGGMNIFEVTKFVNEPFSDSDTDAPFDNLVSLSIEYTLDATGRKIQAAYTHLNISIDWRYDGVGYRCLHAWSGKPF